MRALGIDFGTSHTVAAVRDGSGAGRPLLFDGSPLLPSGVYLDPGGTLVAGREAARAARLDPARFEPHPKRRVDDGSVLLGDREVPVPDLVAAVLRRVRAEARRFVGDDAPVFLAHPAGWSAPRQAVLREAAARAGWPAPRLVPEPVAAAGYFTAVLRAAVPPGGCLAVYDLGGGTFDAAVVRRLGTGFEVLSADGLADVGGVDFDQALVEHLGRGYARSRTAVWQGVVRPGGAAARRQRALLYDDVRGGKEALSRMSAADVHLPVLDVSAHVTRDELENLIREPLIATVDCLSATVAAAGLVPQDLVGVFLVGGSSRIPLAARLIHTRLGVAPTALEQPETVVAQGALCLPEAGGRTPVSGSGSGAVSAPPAGPLPAVAGRPWYAEPGFVGVLVLGVLVLAAAAVLAWLLATGWPD
jgi:molecular chaperone DnaK (HSP70)